VEFQPVATQSCVRNAKYLHLRHVQLNPLVVGENYDAPFRLVLSSARPTKNHLVQPSRSHHRRRKQTPPRRTPPRNPRKTTPGVKAQRQEPLECSGSAAALDQARIITQTIPRSASRFRPPPVAAGAAGHPLRLSLQLPLPSRDLRNARRERRARINATNAPRASPKKTHARAHPSERSAEHHRLGPGPRWAGPTAASA